MPFNVSTFNSQVLSSGFLKPNKFGIIINVPPMFVGTSIVDALNKHTSTSEIVHDLRFRVEDFVNPSISLNMVDVNRYGIGPTQKQPFNAVYNTTTLTFTSDSYGSLWQFWYQWISNIFGSAPNVNLNMNQYNPLATYSLNYKSDYATSMSLYIFDDTGNIAQQIDFSQAFPFAINDIRLNWGLNNQLLKITVDIAYTNYVITGSSVSGVTLNTF